MNVPLLDLSIQHKKLGSDIENAIRNVINHGKFILGPEVELLEEEVARLHRSKHAVSCASGSDALLLALMAYDIKEGDEVITSPYSFFATASCIARVGAKAIFADICPHCYNVHPQEILRKISPKTKAIIPVHLYGQSADMDPYLDLAKRKNIVIIEDACQAIGATYNTKMAGSLGDIGTLSFFPSKNLGGMGDGGMLLTDNDQIAHKLRILRVHGSEPKYYHKLLGINSRLDTLQSAVLRTKLPHLSGFAEARVKNAKFYNERLVESGIAQPALVHEKCESPITIEKHLVLPAARSTGHVFNQYVLRTHNQKLRDGLREHLKTKGIGTEIYYPVPLHLQECFSFWGYKKGDFPYSENAGDTTLAIPIYPELLESQLRYIVDAIKSFSWNI
jgi:dTDP-4-amino-4,6-dideoxygalactose transaminase